MILDDIARYNPIYIQMHDNPDADAIASGYGLFCYMSAIPGKVVKLIYSGKNKISKSNLILMLEHLKINVEHVTDSVLPNIDLPNGDKSNPILVTVDCQYGAQNVTKFDCPNIAIIDHHQIEIEDVEMSLILPVYDSCSAIIWMLLQKKQFNINSVSTLGTALYYGVFADTNQFSELHNPGDHDAIEQLPCDVSIITYLKNSIISLDEMEIAGKALQSYVYDDINRCAVVRVEKCDPNLIGLISDFLIQVDAVDTCVAFSELETGIKFSVRSSIKEVNAAELAGYISRDVGSGGGHVDKAGGYLSQKLLIDKYQDMHAEKYFSRRLAEYYSSFDLIYHSEFNIQFENFNRYAKRNVKMGYVKISDVMPSGTHITCRTAKGDLDFTITDDMLIMIGIEGEVYPYELSKFNKSYRMVDEPYVFEEKAVDAVYKPTVRNDNTGVVYNLTEFARSCESTGSVLSYAHELERGLKLFTAWDEDSYISGLPGDYLVVRSDDLHDISIIKKSIFDLTYSQINL